MKKITILVFIALNLITHAQEKDWVLTTGKVEVYTGIVAANGRIGILPEDKPFQTKSIILNNVYEKESELGVSRIISGMNFANLDVFIDGEKITEQNVSDWKQSLNMKTAAFETSFTFKDKAKITYTIYALRNIQYAGYIDINILPLKNIKIKATGKISTPEEFLNPLSTFRILKDNEVTMPILQTVAKSKFGKHTIGTSATFVWHAINSGREEQRPHLTHEKVSDYENHLSFEKELKKNETYEFAWTGAECSTQDFEDPQTESERFVIFNLLTPRNDLIDQHKISI